MIGVVTTSSLPNAFKKYIDSVECYRITHGDTGLSTEAEQQFIDCDKNPLWDPHRNSGARMQMTRVQIRLPGGRNSARLGSGSEPVAEYQRLWVPGGAGIIIPTLWTARTQKESSGTLDSSIFNIHWFRRLIWILAADLGCKRICESYAWVMVHRRGNWRIGRMDLKI